jgi:hypothetical protein
MTISRTTIIFSIAFLILSCARQVTKQTVVIQKGHEIVSVEKKDTLGYYISFTDSAERQKFVGSFERLVKTYPFRRDTLAFGRYFSLTLPPPPPPEAPRPRPVVAETLAAAPQTAVPSARKAEPRAGGSVTIYSQREFVDPVLSGLIASFPFGKDACGGSNEAGSSGAAGVLDLRPVSDRQIDITLKDNFVTARGQSPTAFDLVNAWTGYIKKHPAEGYAIFKYVKGIEGFIAGREAIINGFVVPDPKTVSLRFEKPDPSAMARLCSRRLLPQTMKTGAYFIKGESPASLQLLPNPRALPSKPYLNSCVIRLGKDQNPFLSFSVNRYDAITIFSLKDIEYARSARQTAVDKSSLVAFSDDRYFLSCAIASKDVRLFARKCVDPKDILVNFVKADGAVLSFIETESGAAPAAEPAGGQALLSTAPPMPNPLSILFRSDDPVSAIIAEKILADFTRAGLQCVLKGAAAEGYEASLVRKDFGIAVGWAEKSVLTDSGERLRLASMWFNDVTDEHARIDDIRELPLFSVKQYLLCKKKIQFAGDVLEGIFIGD